MAVSVGVRPDQNHARRQLPRACRSCFARLAPLRMLQSLVGRVGTTNARAGLCWAKASRVSDVRQQLARGLLWKSSLSWFAFTLSGCVGVLVFGAVALDLLRGSIQRRRRFGCLPKPFAAAAVRRRRPRPFRCLPRLPLQPT